jgi:hypothetical protein
MVRAVGLSLWVVAAGLSLAGCAASYDSVEKRYQMISKKPRYFPARRLLVVLLLTLVTGCVSKRQLPPYPSDWPAINQKGCDCSAISGTYADNGVEADANGSRTARSLSHLLEVEDPNKIQHVVLRLGPIGDFDEGELVIAAMRDGTVVKTRTLAYKCVNGEAVYEKANAGAFYLFLMFFESNERTLTMADDRSLVIKSFFRGRAFVMVLIPVWNDSAHLLRFERTPDDPVK